MHASVAQQSRVPPYQRIHPSLTILLSFCFSPQLRLHARQQDRVPRVAEFDGGGVPGTSYHQLGRDSLGQKTSGVVGGPGDIGDGVINRGLAARLPRLQGMLFYPSHLPSRKWIPLLLFGILLSNRCLGMLVILLACLLRNFANAIKISLAFRRGIRVHYSIERNIFEIKLIIIITYINVYILICDIRLLEQLKISKYFSYIRCIILHVRHRLRQIRYASSLFCDF